MRKLLLSTAFLAFMALAALGAASGALAGGACHDDRAATAGAASTGATTVVKVDGCTFAPTVNTVPVGARVTFLNTSDSPHDVTGRRGEWASPMLDPGQSHIQRFDKPGVYPYSCSLHPGMAGVVMVGEAIDASVASNPAPTPRAPAATASTDPLTIASAGGLGLLGGVLVGGLIVRRRRETA
jgi:plastocyanin